MDGSLPGSSVRAYLPINNTATICSVILFYRMKCCCCCCSIVVSPVWLCDPMDYGPPGFSVHGIFQARVTGVACHFLLQRIFLTQRPNLYLLCLLHCQADSLPLSQQGRPQNANMITKAKKKPKERKKDTLSHNLIKQEFKFLPTQYIFRWEPLTIKFINWKQICFSKSMTKSRQVMLTAFLPLMHQGVDDA